MWGSVILVSLPHISNTKYYRAALCRSHYHVVATHWKYTQAAVNSAGTDKSCSPQVINNDWYVLCIQTKTRYFINVFLSSTPFPLSATFADLSTKRNKNWINCCFIYGLSNSDKNWFNWEVSSYRKYSTLHIRDILKKMIRKKIFFFLLLQIWWAWNQKCGGTVCQPVMEHS